MSKTAIPAPAARAAAAKPSRSQVVPPDDEPLTVADLREIRESEAALRRGDYVTLEELEDDVARLHSKEAGKKASPVPAQGQGSRLGRVHDNASRSVRR